MTLDSGGRRLTVVASPDDHQVLKSAIEQVDKAVQAEEKRKLVTYSVSPSQRTRFQAIAASLTAELPGIQVMANTEPGELVIWAKPSQQVVIADLLEQLKRQVPTSEKYQLVAYSIKAANPSSLLSVLKTLFPNAQITPDARSRRLIIWALPSEQEAIKSAIEKIDAAGPAETQEKLMVYPVSDIDPATAILSLQEALPDIKLISDAKAGTLLAWASPWEHQAIEKVLKQMQAGAEAQSKPKLVVYEVAEGDPVSMVAVLRALVPRAQVVADAKTRSIGATATPQEHELIRSAVEQMSKKEPPEKAHRLVTYTIDAGRRSAISTVISILGEQYPGARFTPGLERGHILAWARPDDQKRIQATIDELTKNTPPPELGYTLAFYAVESGGATAVNNAIGILKSLFPDAYLSASSEPGKLLAWARPKDQPRIAQIVKEVGQGEPPETAQRLEVYVLHSTSSSKGRRAQPPNAGVIAVLTTMFPEAHFSPGTDAMQVVVLARPADHVKIKAAVAELDKSEPPESAPRVLAYTLESAGPAGVTGAISLLQTLFPEAQFSAGSEPGSLVALARPDDHLAIKAAIAEMSKKEPPDKARKMVAYTLDAGGPYGFSYALTTLRTAFPDAQFSLGADPNRLVAWARPAEHQAIQIAIDEMSKKEPPDKAPSVATYRLDAIDATTAISLLRTTFADARFSVGADASSLIVWARPADQALIKKTLAEIETGGGPNDHRVLSVYPFKSHDVTALTQLLDPALRRGIQLVPDPTRSRLLVWADVKHQEVVKGVIEQFARETAKAGEPTSQVYRFEWADPRAAYTVLATLVPNAQIALDPVSHSLVVSAMPEDHAKIKATVAEMDRRDANGQSPRLEIYRFQSSDPANMMPVLQGLFRLYPEVRLSLDDANGAIVALATPAQQETIRSLVEKVEKQAAVDGNVSLEVYPLGDAHATSTLRMLTTLLDKESRKVQLSVEPYNNSLVAIARPEQQKVIRAALEQIKPEERTLEVIQLDMVDATTAQLAIERLFSDGGYTYNSSAPGVDIDSTTQQVFVRATAKQHEKIRELLIRMGETSLAQPSGTDTRRSRQIPFDGDLNAAVEEIKRVWPQLRPNPIQVVTPPQVLIRQRPPEPGQQPIQPAAGPEQAPGKPLPKNEIRPPTAQRSSDSPTPAPGGAAAAAKPVIVVPGEGSVTITSDDPAALNQFEMLLRAMSRQRGTVGRNYNVYLLRNASASSVAATLQQVFRVLPGRAGRRPAASAASGVGVPDARLNAIVAYANRTDRNTIENLIKVLDTAEMPETLDADRLQLIPIKNTSAEKIVQSLKTMFKSYVDGFSVEETTNSVVVMAAPQTVEEIKRVANLLDEAAGGKASREVEIVPLRKLKSAQVEKALQTILKTPPPRSSRSRSAGGR